MSHFTVLVIGEDVEKALQPFHEFECTGIDDEYVQDVDVTAEIQARMSEKGESLEDALSWHGLEDRIVSNESELDRGSQHKFGYAIVENGRLVKAIDRTNPQKRWDGWMIGGRWSGLFKLKPGAFDALVGVESGEPIHQERKDGNQACKRDIDFDFMRDAAVSKAASKYDAVHRVIAGRSWRTWEQVRDEDHPGNIEAARDAYWEQPVVTDIQHNEALRDIIGFRNDIAPYAVPREEYLARARRNAGVTHAVIKDGKWYERGRMGWWAVVHDEKDDDAWSREFAALIDDLPDDALLTVVDCHI